MKQRYNSREDWEQDIVERQHNLAPADITRTSQFRASGLPKSAPLPIAIRRSRMYIGVALFALSVAMGAFFEQPVLLVVGGALACF